jgi:hypothetical protein
MLAEDVALMGDMRNAFKIFIWKPESKTPLGRPRRRPRCETKGKKNISLSCRA